MSGPSGGPPARMISRRWFQFSLRGFLVAVTIGCIYLGWNVEQARRRGRAIDAIVEAGGLVISSERLLHNEFSDDYSSKDHFWLDLKRVPLTVVLREKTNFATIDSELWKIGPIDNLHIWCPVNDDDLRHISGLNDGGKIRFFAISEIGMEHLQNRLPNVEITAEIIKE